MEIDMDEKKIKKGEPFEFDNEEWCIRNESDDLRGGRIEFSPFARRQVFWLWFNGKIIHSSRGFESMRKRYKILAEKWHLEKSI